MKRAALYVRVSEDPSGKEAGVGRQEEDARALASKRGWEVVGVYRDNDKSASSGKPRPAWERLLRDIEAGQVDALVAYSSSRLYRRLADLVRLLDLVEKRHLAIALVVSGDLDLATADGRMLAGILASIDQGEAQRTSERVRRARKAAVAQGRYTGGFRPFGWEAVPNGRKRLADGRDEMTLSGRVVEEEAALIRQAATDLLRGASINSVVRRWRAEGVQTSRGGDWSTQAFRRMMLSPRLAGLHPESGERAVWEPILARRDHAALVAMLKDPSRRTSPTTGGYLLTPYLRCGRCGARMKGSRKAGQRRYICRVFGQPVHLAVAADAIETYVVDAADERPDPTLPEALDPAQVDRDLLDKLTVADDRLDAFAREAALAGMSAREIQAGRAPLLASKAQLEVDLVSARPAAPGSLWVWLAPAEVDREVRAWLNALVDHVVVLPAPRPGARFTGARCRVVWR